MRLGRQPLILDKKSPLLLAVRSDRDGETEKVRSQVFVEN
jgi:hypothetical protein